MILKPWRGGGRQFHNHGDAEAHGLETQLQLHYEAVEGRVSYTYQQNRNADTDSPANSPAHMIKFNLSAPLWSDKLFAGLEVQYVSSRATVASQRTAAYALTNLTLFSRRWLPGVELSGGVYNLFDHNYADPASPPLRPDVVAQDGRNFRLRFGLEF